MWNVQNIILQFSFAKHFKDIFSFGIGNITLNLQVLFFRNYLQINDKFLFLTLFNATFGGNYFHIFFHHKTGPMYISRCIINCICFYSWANMNEMNITPLEIKHSFISIKAHIKNNRLYISPYYWNNQFHSIDLETRYFYLQWFSNILLLRYFYIVSRSLGGMIYYNILTFKIFYNYLTFYVM